MADRADVLPTPHAKHEVECATGATYPGVHSVHKAEAPPKLARPGVQDAQLTIPSTCCPAAHDVTAASSAIMQDAKTGGVTELCINTDGCAREDTL